MSFIDIWKTEKICLFVSRLVGETDFAPME